MGKASFLEILIFHKERIYIFNLKQSKERQKLVTICNMHTQYTKTQSISEISWSNLIFFFHLWDFTRKPKCQKQKRIAKPKSISKKNPNLVLRVWFALLNINDTPSNFPEFLKKKSTLATNFHIMN